MGEVKSDFGDITMVKIPFNKYILCQAEEKFADRVAMIQDDTGDKMIYGQMAHYIRCIGSALHARGYKQQEKLLIYSGNTLLYPCVFHGAGLIGMVSTMCNPLYTTEELVRHLNDSEAVVLVTLSCFKEKARDAAKEYGKLREMFLFDGPTDDDFMSLDELLQGDPKGCPDLEIDMNSTCCMPYSSGTTGFPKGVCLSHRSLQFITAQLSHERFNCLMDENEVCLGVVPFYHGLGMGIKMGLAFTKGATVIVQGRFQPENFLRAIEKYKVTSMHIVPPIAIMMSKHPLAAEIDTSSLRYINCAAAPLALSVFRALKEKLPHVRITQMYGMTETLLLTHGIFDDHNEPELTVGKVLPNTTVKIVDVDTEEVCGPNKPGEIWAKGPGLQTFHYYGKKEATEAMFSEDGYIKTGDVGYYDEDGYFFIVDRVKELIKYKANQVAPAELESLLLSHPSIADAAVIGIPDENAGELPKAFVVKKPGCQALTEEQVAQYIAEKVAPQKKLRGGVEFRESIPKLPSGKILRRILRAEAAEANKKA